MGRLEVWKLSASPDGEATGSSARFLDASSRGQPKAVDRACGSLTMPLVEQRLVGAALQRVLSAARAQCLNRASSARQINAICWAAKSAI